MSENLPDICRVRLSSGCDELGLHLSEQTQTRLLEYVSLLNKWNKAFNLTAIRDPEQMVIRHVLDALTVLPFLDDKPVLDVGTGGGIPGIIIALCRPDQSITLLDSNGKKTRFLRQAKNQLGINNVEVVQSRAESYSPPVLFDRIISRAFTALDNMVSWCEPLLAQHGVFLAMKGMYPEPNQKPLPSGWQIKEAIPLDVPFTEEQRHLVTITRIAN